MFRATHRINPLLILLGLGLAAPTLEAQKGRAIAGQVVDDAGKPVAGATVRLVSGPYPGLPVSLHHFLQRRGPAFEAVARTDDSGRFRITAKTRYMICLHAEDGTGEATRMSAPMVPVLPGDYRVLRLQKAAAVSGVVRGSEDDKPVAGARIHGSIYTAPSSGFTKGSFTLGMQTVTDKDGAYTLRVPAGFCLDLEAESGGRVVRKVLITPGPEQDLTFTAGTVVEGIVQGPDGKPVAGAVLQDPYYPWCRTRSDAAGKFKLLLAANRYWVHVAHPQLAHATDYTRQATRVRARGQKVNKKTKVRVLRLQKGTRLRARVLGPEGKPLRSARVVLGGIAKRLNSSGMLSMVMAWPAKLDDAGVLDVSCMYKGYAAYAWVEVNGEFVQLFGGDVGGGIDMGDVKLPLAGRLHGIVQLPTRMPAAGARVLLRRRFDSAPQSTRNTTIALPFIEVPTDRGGRFRIDGLQPGTYDIAVAMPNYFPLLTKAKVSGEDQQLRIAMPEGKTMSGKLVDADDQPVPHRPIRIFLPSNRTQKAYRRLGFNMFEPITDSNGRFVFHGLPDGQLYRIYVYFRVNGQTYRSNPIPNIQPDAQDLELMLTTPMPKVGGGR